MSTLDLNADLAEGFGAWSLTEDDALLDVVTSANVACGFHAGDPATMRRVCARAAEVGVRIGAQVSYRDLAGFGRRFVDETPEDLAADVLYQVGALRAMARAAGTDVAYLKPHGALYNTAVTHEEHAGAVVDAALAAGDLPVLGLPGSRLLALAAEAGLETVGERARRLARDGVVVAVDGTEVAVTARSLCLHGDSPGAVASARAVATALSRAGVTLSAFA